MNLTLNVYPLSVKLIADIHMLLSELPAKTTRNVLNNLDAELLVAQKQEDARIAGEAAAENLEPTKE